MESLLDVVVIGPNIGKHIVVNLHLRTKKKDYLDLALMHIPVKFDEFN